MPKKKTARKTRTVLGAEDLKPGVRFKYGGFYGRPSVGVEILRSRESATGDFGLPRDRWWSRNLDTGEEGYVSLGPGGKLNVDAVLGAESGQPRHLDIMRRRSRPASYSAFSRRSSTRSIWIGG